MPLFIKKLGIDLGTANTLVFVPNEGVVLNEPSVVAVSVPENKVLAVGNEAKVMVGKTPDSITAYRPMKDGVIADYRVTEAMLRYYITKAIGKWNLFKPEVMISVPAGVIKEPILAAIGAGIPIHEPIGHMVVDIGGGTTDAAVISLGGIVASTSVKVAGNKIDQAIADYIKKTSNLIIGERTAEQIKIEIGSAIPVDKDEHCQVKGRDFITGLPRSITASANEIQKAIDPELREIMRAIKNVLQETPPELASDIIDKGIVMTGGTSLLRNIGELVYRSTGVRAQIAEDALLCVAKGTGIALDHLEVYKKNVLAKR